MADLGNMFGPGQSMFYLQKYLPLMQKMMQTSDTTDPYKELLDTMHGQYTDALGAASSAETDLNSAQAQPAQQVSPMQSGLATLMGGVSSVLAPNLRGNEMAQGALAKKNQGFEDMRKERLQRMESHYETLAKRAEQLGNMELSLKMSAKAESIKSKQEKEREAMSLAGTLANSDAQRATSLDIARMQEDGVLKRAQATLAARGIRLNPDGTIVQAPPTMDAKTFTNGLTTLRLRLNTAKTDDEKKATAAELYSHQMNMTTPEAANPALWVRRVARIQPMKITKRFMPDSPLSRAPSATEIANTLATNLTLDLSDPVQAQTVIHHLELGLRGVNNPATGKPYTADEIALAAGWVLQQKK